MLLAGKTRQTAGRFGWNGRIGFAVAVAASGLSAAAPVSAGPSWPAEVKAGYTISFAGIEVGGFRFQSNVTGRRYVLDSEARIKVLFGAFKWNSKARTEGVLRSKPTPKLFDLKYNTRKKHVQTTMQFAGNDVSLLRNRPPARYTPKHVPLQKRHLTGVVDPMTAIMAMTDGGSRNPCQRVLDVFEGKMRLRIELSPKGQIAIRDRKPNGLPAYGLVCRVKVTPVAGYKRGSAVAKLSESETIEIVLRPVPTANTFIPYRIVIPTGYGTVVIASKWVEIVDERAQRIALRY